MIGGRFEDTNQPNILISDVQSRIPAIGQYIQEKFPQYLEDSYNISTETILTTERVYFLMTYQNSQGLFLAIGSDDSEGNKQVNTFVRLGAGSASKQATPIKLDTKLI